MNANAPFELRPIVERFMRQRGAGPVGLARYMPASWAKSTDCIANVLAKVTQDGGKAVFGWTFSPRFNPQHGRYVVATHHAVWHSPSDSSLVDITPLHPDAHHHPATSGGDTIFLVDATAPPHRQGNVVAPLPLSFLAVVPEPPGLNAYLHTLARDEEAQWKEHLDMLAKQQPSSEA